MHKQVPTCYLVSSYLPTVAAVRRAGVAVVAVPAIAASARHQFDFGKPGKKLQHELIFWLELMVTHISYSKVWSRERLP